MEARGHGSHSQAPEAPALDSGVPLQWAGAREG